MDRSASIRIDELDERLTSPAFIADPYPTYAELRATDPVHWSPRWGVWVITGYDDTLRILKDPVSFSNAGRFSALLDQLPPDVQPDVDPVRRHYSGGLIQSDPPDHTRLRSLLRDVFSPRAIDRQREQVQAVVDNLLSQALGDRSMDAVRDFAYPLPLFVVANLLGAPPTDRDQMFRWNTDLAAVQATGGAAAANARRTADAIGEMERYFSNVVEERRRAPGVDLISQLIAAKDEGNKLTNDEIVNTAVTIMSAGHETTKNLIANALVILFNHPTEMRALREDPSLMDAAIEEFLRYESPIQRGWRRTTRKIEISGKLIESGALVYYMFGAANRDPARFENPDQFDIRRANNRHLAFGYGIHFCIGAPLARLEASVALHSLLKRTSVLDLVETNVDWVPSVHVRCPLRLNVILHD